MRAAANRPNALPVLLCLHLLQQPPSSQPTNDRHAPDPTSAPTQPNLSINQSVNQPTNQPTNLADVVDRVEHRTLVGDSGVQVVLLACTSNI